MSSVLTLNGGSSSIRFAFFDAGDLRRRLIDGKVERIGLPGTTLTVGRESSPLPNQDGSVVPALLNRLERMPQFAALAGIGHRVVFGMQRTRPERVTAALLADLTKVVPFDPEHLPSEIGLMQTLLERHPALPQVACFDTAFHAQLPRVAAILPIPRRYEAKGVRRYGFHGLSYTYLMGELARLDARAAAHGRVILAHLGNGASLAAVRAGRCIDTTMAFTPTAGLVMSTRSGDLDPGIGSFLAASEGLTAAGFQRMVTRESGLLGISETSSDVRDLLARERDDVRAREALEVFCYQVRKWIGAYTAALGGLDALVFAGGIGEHAAPIRARICAELGCLGIDLDEARNATHGALISRDAAAVAVRVIPTDEESVIAAATARSLQIDTIEPRSTA